MFGQGRNFRYYMDSCKIVLSPSPPGKAIGPETEDTQAH